MLLSRLTNYQDRRDVEVSGLVLDSRAVRPGYLFFAIPGRYTDGRQYINEAIRAGACAVLYQSDSTSDCPESWGLISETKSIPIIAVADLDNKLENYAKSFYSLPQGGCIGVTGTNGKTTIASFIQQLLGACNEPCGYIGTLGCSSTIAGSSNYDERSSSLTTPDIFTLYASLESLFSRGCKYIVMETSSHALDQGRLNGIDFDYGVFSNLSREHLDYHKSLDDYFRAKQILFNQCKKSIINVDDHYGRKLIETLDYSTTIGYSTQTDRDKNRNVLIADKIEKKLDCVDFRLNYAGQEQQIHANLTGLFSIYNLIAALAVLLDMGHKLENLAIPVSRLVVPKGRLEQVFDKPTIFIDYAHTPDALENCLREIHSIMAMTTGRLHLVFGCGGDRDSGKRSSMGAIASRYADRIVITDDNPRSESSSQIIDHIVSGIDPSHLGKLVIEQDRAKAIALAVQDLDYHDCLLIAGKGHETKQIFSDKTIEFSDHKQVRQTLKAQGFLL